MEEKCNSHPNPLKKPFDVHRRYIFICIYSEAREEKKRKSIHVTSMKSSTRKPYHPIRQNPYTPNTAFRV